MKELFEGDAAISRIPVVSANGTPLMPCKPTKAFKLVKLGKAFWKRGQDGKLYLKLRFNPRSPMVHPQAVVQPNASLSSSFLAEVKKEARSKRVWFRLSKVERGILDLTIKCVKKPRSPRLIGVLAKIVVKIKASLASPLQKLVGQVGKPLAKRLSMIAESWGNKEAEKWAEDEGFAMYLTIINILFQTTFKARGFNRILKVEEPFNKVIKQCENSHP